jgi:hypothetical protein
LDTELSYPISVKDSFLTCTGYRRDAADQNSTTGGGYEKRKSMFATSKTVQLMHKIDADIFNQELYLISNVEIDVEITPNETDFLIIIPERIAAAANTNNYAFEITNCRLFVKTIDLMDGLSLDIARRLDTQPARYGLRKTLLKSLFITEGRTEYTNAIYTDEVPRRIILGLLENSAYNGSKFKSPFNFKNFDLREITISASGRTYPQVPYNLDYGNDRYVRAFHDFCEYTGQAYGTESNGIDYSMYKSGWCLYAFSLSNSMENENCFELIKVAFYYHHFIN